MRRSRRKVLKAGAALAAVSALPRRAFAQAGPIRIGMSMPQTGTLGAGPLAGRGIDRIIYGAVIMVIAAGRPDGLLSLPWERWAGRLLGRAPAESAKG